MEQIFKRPKYSYVYALIDPRNNKIRYIGKSINPNKRYSNHLCQKKNSSKDKWIRRLKKKNLKPILKVICKCLRKNVNKFEKKYITIYKKQLFNERSGGEGWNLKYKRRWSIKCLNGGIANMKKVKIKNLKTGKVKEFKSVKACAEYLDSPASNMTEALKRNKDIQTIKNHIVAYINDEFIEPFYKSMYSNIKRINIETNTIKVYNTMNDVVDDGFDYSSVIKILQGNPYRHTHRGYKWEID